MRYAVCAAALLTACATSSRSTSEAPPAEAKLEREPSRIQFIANDYEGALARARAEGRPLFVDTWAPW